MNPITEQRWNVGDPTDCMSLIVAPRFGSIGKGLGPSTRNEAILVDGWSVDGTTQVARRCRPDIRIVRQTRKGKGNALACGFAAVTGDVVVMLDADGSADPAEITRFVGSLVAGADFAKGTRFA